MIVTYITPRGLWVSLGVAAPEEKGGCLLCDDPEATGLIYARFRPEARLMLLPCASRAQWLRVSSLPASLRSGHGAASPGGQSGKSAILRDLPQAASWPCGFPTT